MRKGWMDLRPAQLPLQVQALPQRHTVRGGVEEGAVGATLADLDVPWVERPDGSEDEHADEGKTPLQVGHATTGWRKESAWNLST